MGLPPGKRQHGFELGQPEVQLRIRHVSGIFKEVGQVKAGQVEKRWREDRAEDILTAENCHVQGLLVEPLDSTTGQKGGMERKGRPKGDGAGSTATLSNRLDVGV